MRFLAKKCGLKNAYQQLLITASYIYSTPTSVIGQVSRDGELNAFMNRTIKLETKILESEGFVLDARQVSL